MAKKTKYRLDISMPVVIEVAEEVLIRNGYDPEDPKIDWDVEAIPIKIIGHNPLSGHVFLEEEYDPEEWPSISEFLNHLRRRLTELIPPELDTREWERQVENLKREIRDARSDADDSWGRGFDSGYEDGLEACEGVTVSSQEALAVTGIRDTMGLEGRERVGVAVANRARTRLNRWSAPTLKDSVRTARAIQAMPHQFRQAILDLLG